MQQIYGVKQVDRQVVHIEMQEDSNRARIANTHSQNNRSFSKTTRNLITRKVTRSTFYVLNKDNNNSTLSLSTTHRQAEQTLPSKRRKASTHTCYETFNKSAVYAEIFTQPIGKTIRTDKKESNGRSYGLADQLYDKIDVMNRNMITKQFQIQQKHTPSPNKLKTIQSRNCSSKSTHEGRLETQKKPAKEMRVKPKPWQARKRGFYLAHTSKKLKTQNQKYSFRCRIDPWEISERDYPQY